MWGSAKVLLQRGWGDLEVDGDLGSEQSHMGVMKKLRNRHHGLDRHGQHLQPAPPTHEPDLHSLKSTRVLDGDADRTHVLVLATANGA